MEEKAKQELLEYARAFIEVVLDTFDKSSVPNVTQISILFSAMCNITIRCGRTKKDLVELLQGMIEKLAYDDFPSPEEIWEHLRDDK